MTAKRQIQIPYTPRPDQARLHRELRRFNVLVSHRRFGKTVWSIAELIKRALACQLPQPRYAYLGPSLTQAKDVAWSYLKHYAAPIPGVAFHEGELRADFNGRRIRLYGAENVDRMRGLYLDGIVIDEPAQQNPRGWTEVIRPTLIDRNGFAIFTGTPMGRNSFCDLYEGATLGFPDAVGQRVKDPDWAGFMFKASGTKLVPQAELDAARRDMSDDQYRQEFECDWDAAILGAYYAAVLQELETQGRIKSVPYEPALPVFTGWDLGIGDATSIWFAQVVNGEVRLIDYYENSGVGLEHYIGQLRAAHRATWNYAQHFFPHDIKVRELGSGLSRVQVLANHGLSPTVLPASSVDDGISVVRFSLRKAWINSDRCADGLKALRQYRSDWDEKRQVLKPVPLHDWASNCADSARYLFVGLGKGLIQGQSLHDPTMSGAARRAPHRPMFAKGAPGNFANGARPYGW